VINGNFADEFSNRFQFADGVRFCLIISLDNMKFRDLS
jgi:hypothetical protein